MSIKREQAQFHIKTLCLLLPIMLLAAALSGCAGISPARPELTNSGNQEAEKVKVKGEKIKVFSLPEYADNQTNQLYGSPKRNNKVILDICDLVVSYRCLTILSVKEDAYAFLFFTKTNKEKILIRNLEWKHIYKDEELPNLENDLGRTHTQDGLPLSDEEVFRFYTNKYADDFAVKDRVMIKVSFEYNLRNTWYRIEDEFEIVCHYTGTVYVD